MQLFDLVRNRAEEIASEIHRGRLDKARIGLAELTDQIPSLFRTKMLNQSVALLVQKWICVCSGAVFHQSPRSLQYACNVILGDLEGKSDASLSTRTPLDDAVLTYLLGTFSIVSRITCITDLVESIDKMCSLSRLLEEDPPWNACHSPILETAMDGTSIAIFSAASAKVSSVHLFSLIKRHLATMNRPPRLWVFHTVDHERIVISIGTKNDVLHTARAILRELS